MKKNKFERSGLIDLFDKHGREVLSPRENQILTLRIGTDTQKAMSQPAIGRQFNLSRERIRQLEDRAINKLSRLQTELAKQGKAARLMLLICLESKPYTDFLERAIEQCQLISLELEQVFKGDDYWLSDIEFTTRASNVLKRHKLTTVGQVLELEDSQGLLSLRNLGISSYKEIMVKIDRFRFGDSARKPLS